MIVNPKPRMTHYLATDTRIFEHDPLVVVDVGARWGFNSEWQAFGDHLRVFCFEPDAQECRRLNAVAPAGVTYLPYALGRAACKTAFYENRVAASSGIYRTNMQYFSRLLNRDNGVVVRESEIELTTLNDVLAERGVKSVDFIKLDVEGAEMDVLLGGERFVRDSHLIGILSEIRFQEEINGSPIFSKFDRFLRRYGFRIYDLQFHHQSRHALPYPGLSDYRTAQGERFFAYTTHGQVQDGDALYFRDLLLAVNAAHRDAVSSQQLLKAAALLELYSFNDCAAELIIAHRQKLSDVIDCHRLLDLLTPELNGATLSYEEYLRRYFDPNGGVFVTPGEPLSIGSHSSEAEIALARVYASRSWRITKPLRDLGVFLRRLRGK